MFEKLRSLFSATKLPPPDAPKVRPGSRSWPTFLTSTKPSDSTIPKNDRRLQNIDLLNYRTGSSDAKVIADFAASSVTLSAAVWHYLRLGIPENYTIVCHSLDGVFDEAATRAITDFVSRLDRGVMGYADGFSSTPTLRSISESLGKELILFGGCAFELVLSKARLPERIMPVSITKIDLKADGKGVRPTMSIGGEEVDLDIPTFYLTTIDQSLLSVYPESPLGPAIKPVLFAEDFFQDLHRVMKRTAFPRTVVTIDHEKFIKNGLSQEAQLDPDKARGEINTLISQIEQKMTGLRPEEALVLLDTLGIETQDSGSAGSADSFQTLREIAENRLAVAAKTMPSVLGNSGTGSQNIASVQTMLGLRSADIIRVKLSEQYSRALTLAVRLLGFDCQCTFKYAPISLRPDEEMEAFRQTSQQRILELLSLGIISDAEAAIQLTGSLPRAGAPQLSGTFFKGNNSPDIQKPQEPSNSGSALNQTLNDTPPAQGRGQNKKVDGKNAEDEHVEQQAPTFVTPNINIAIDNTQEKSASIIKMRRDEDGNLTLEKTNAA